MLFDWNNGDQDALNKLMPLVYDELRRLAANHLRRERRDHTLQTGALVNEAYLRLIDQTRASSCSISASPKFSTRKNSA